MGKFEALNRCKVEIVHELGHYFIDRSNRGWLIQMREGWYTQNKIAKEIKLRLDKFVNDVYVELITASVGGKLFPEQLNGWIERQRYGNNGVYDYINTLTPEDNETCINSMFFVELW